MKKNKLKSQAGITLTILMITIVVLSILVTIVVRHKLQTKQTALL